MKKSLALLIFATSFLLTNCNKEKESVSELTLKFNLFMGKSDFQFDTPYLYVSPMKFKLERIDFLVTNIKLHSDDNKVVDLKDQPQFFNQENMSNILKSIPTGNYKKLELSFGVPANLNTQNGADAIIATDYPATSALNPANSMYWGWVNGYIFSKFEGRIDTDNNASFGDANDITFSYHPGNDDLFRTVELPINLTIEAGKTANLNLNLDLRTLFMNVRFDTYPTAHPNSNSGADFDEAKKLVDLWSDALTVME